MTRTFVLAAMVLIVTSGIAAADPSGNNVVITEIYPNPPGTYDGAEYIELYNPTDSDIDIGGWVLCGTEYEASCGGEDRWQFPVGTSIPAGGYIVVSKDGNETGQPYDDSFYHYFGFNPDFEMYDPSFQYDYDSPAVPNLTLLDDDPATYYSDEIQLVGGKGYGVMCHGYSNADVVYLYTSGSLLTLVDLVEYYDPDECTADPCAGDDGADDNAYPGIAYLGNALGRDHDGTDTDNSSADFRFREPTPRQANTLNTPPWMRDVRYSPIPPTDAGPVDITCTITDDSGIAEVRVYYNVDGGGWSYVTATADPGNSVYVGTIGAQPDGSQVEYYVWAEDDSSAVMTYPAEGADDPYAYRVGYVPISYIQEPVTRQDESPYLGQAVNVRGIVTAKKGEYSSTMFYIHEGNGFYEGIKCYVPGYYDEINEGDDITICGTVSEYYDETEIYLHFPEALVVHSTGNPNYGYLDATTAQLAPSNPDAERYEGQLVRVTDATVTYEPDEYGQWYVRDSSGTDAEVDDYAYYSYDPEVLDVISELRGIVMYNYSEYKIEPRYDEDIIGPPRIGDVRYTPIPPTAGQQVTVTAVFKDNSDIASGTLYWSYSPTGPWTGVAMALQTRDVEETWAATIGPFNDGDRIYYYVVCEDDGSPAMDARKPTSGSYSFYVGIESIYDVQYVAPGGDTSPLDTLAVNVEGYVTVEPGVFNDNTFYIADASGPWNGIMVYDRTGTVTYNRGDYVVCCGQVEEYYGQTQISLHFPEATQLATPPRSEAIAPTSISTGMLQNVVSGEQYESVYVYAEDCTVEDADLGYGEWAITNGAPEDTCRVDDYADYDYEPNVGDNVYVKGVVAFSYGNYKIEPRGNEDIAVNPVGIPDDAVGARFGLLQNMPNPFNPKTTIAFTLPETGDVSLEVFDVAGRKVATLLDGQLDAGPHRVEWNGVSDSGERVASGVYFYRLTAGGEKISKKMVLLK